MRLLGLLLLAALTRGALAQDAPVEKPGGEGRRGEASGLGLTLGLSGSLQLARGDFADAVGGRHGGGSGFIGVQGAHWAFGLDVASHTVERREETVALPSGPSVDLVTTTDLGRVGAFARFGPRFGRVHAYAEGLLGANVLGTRTRLARAGPDDEGEEERTSVAPAAGGGVGVAVRVEGMPLAVYAQARVVYGGAATYLVYDEGAGRFVERRSGTTAGYVGVGLMFGF